MHQLYPPPNPNPQRYRHHVLRPATTPTTTKHGHNHVSSCGFPAASDGALERVNQAIQEYRRDVTQLDMSAYYTMMSKLTRHGTDAPSELAPSDDEPVGIEGSPTFPHDTPPSKRQRTHTAALSDDELASTSVGQQAYTSSHRPVAPSDSDTEWELDGEPWDGAARHGAARHGAA